MKYKHIKNLTIASGIFLAFSILIEFMSFRQGLERTLGMISLAIGIALLFLTSICTLFYRNMRVISQVELAQLHEASVGTSFEPILTDAILNNTAIRINQAKRIERALFKEKKEKAGTHYCNELKKKVGQQA